MKWKQREQELNLLRLKYKRNKWRVPFPDLSVEQRAAPLGNKFAPICYSSKLPSDAKQFPVGHSHKQGLEMITPGMDLKWMGGTKP